MKITDKYLHYYNGSTTYEIPLIYPGTKDDEVNHKLNIIGDDWNQYYVPLGLTQNEPLKIKIDDTSNTYSPKNINSYRTTYSNGEYANTGFLNYNTYIGYTTPSMKVTCNGSSYTGTQLKSSSYTDSSNVVHLCWLLNPSITQASASYSFSDGQLELGTVQGLGTYTWISNSVSVEFV